MVIMIKELLTSENIKKMGFVPCQGSSDSAGYISHLYYYKGFYCIQMDCFAGNWSLIFNEYQGVSFEELCRYTKHTSYQQMFIEDKKNNYNLSSLDEVKDIAEDWLRAFLLIVTKKTEDNLSLLYSIKRENGY